MDKIIAFVHIPKVGGSAIQHLLRSIYGVNHCRAINASGKLYQRSDLIEDQRIYPHVKVLSGHRLRPFIDFGEYEAKMCWLTFLRDPVKRFPSQYHNWLKGNEGRSMSFSEWCAIKGDKFADFQVRWIAGEPDVEKAKKILSEKFSIVGIQEDFPTSFRIIRQVTGEENFPTSFEKRVNKAKVDPRTYEALDEKLIHKYNQLDIELYEFVMKEIWPKQVAQLNAAPVVDQPFRDKLQYKINRNLAKLKHRFVYERQKR